VGRAAFKKGSIPRAVAMPSHPPCIAPFHLLSPRVGSTRTACVLLLLEEHDLVGVGALQPSLGFKDFHHAARLHSLTNGHPG
jgi:hypothetical protein